MKRIADLDPDQMSPPQRAVYNEIVSGPRKGVRAPLSVWLHRPELGQNAQALGRYCRYETSLPPRLSELAILTLARVWGSEYAWYEHMPVALKAGVSPDVVEAIRTNDEPFFVKADEAVIHTFLTDLHRDRKVSDAVYVEAIERLGEAGVIDLVGLAGYYTLSCMTMTVFQVAQPAGVASELGA
jgi:4-carboxymuconolactone decarboxylase